MPECPICMDGDAVYTTETCHHPVCLLCFHRIYRTIDIYHTPYLKRFAEEYAIPEEVAIRMACWMEHQDLHKMVDYTRGNGCPVCRARPNVKFNSRGWFDTTNPVPAVVLPSVESVGEIVGDIIMGESGLVTLRQLLLDKEKLLVLHQLQEKTEENLEHQKYVKFLCQKCVVISQECSFQYTNVRTECPFPNCQFSADSHQVTAWAQHINNEHTWDSMCTECDDLSNVECVRLTELEKTDKVAFLLKLARHYTLHHPGPLCFSENCCIYFCT